MAQVQGWTTGSQGACLERGHGGRVRTVLARAVGSANVGEHVGQAGRVEAQQWHRQERVRTMHGMDEGWTTCMAGAR